MAGWGRFTKAKPRERLSLTWASQGLGGQGKTHFALTAPGPIALMLFDPDGIDPLLRKSEFKKLDIHKIEYGFNPGKLSEAERPAAAKAAYEQFKEDYAVAIANARTVVWDKEEHVWEMLRYAHLEGVSDAPKNYYELNLEYRGWFADAAEAGVNLGVIRGMKEKWGTNAKGSPTGTGEYIPRGQREVNELVQVVLHHFFEDGAFKVRIGGAEGCDDPKCRVGDAAGLIGEVFDNLTFEELAIRLYPEYDEEAWQ